MKNDLQRKRKSKNPKIKNLTGVIPVLGSLSDLTNLKHTLIQAHTLNVRIIIVVDTNGKEISSSMRSLVSANRYSIEIIIGDFSGPGQARNAGLKRVKTNYVAFWDADDLVKIENILKEMNSIEGDFEFLVGSYTIVNSKTGRKTAIKNRRYFWKIQLILKPGLWRIVFATDCVRQNTFGTSRMGEDQVFLCKSEIFTSKNKILSKLLFYDYHLHLSNQLTNQRNRFVHLNQSINEIFNVYSIKPAAQKKYIFLVIAKLKFTLYKNSFRLGKKS
jgi:glycosyltransferase involved in cell wall biosynthesis